MSRLKRIVVFVAVLVFILSVTLPLSAFAVDPVSASVMANAFAQAIAAYGASNGVAMTFDVTSTDGIGESVHELWKDFREGTQTSDDYATLAAAIFPDLYFKTSVALGTASDVYAVGVHISDTYAETLDDFYNWLLSGPAEMVQVDNSYYEFSQSQIGSDSSPVPVYFLPSSYSQTLLSYIPSGTYGTWQEVYDHSFLGLSGTLYNKPYGSAFNQRNSSSSSIYLFGVSSVNNNNYHNYDIYSVSSSSFSSVVTVTLNNNTYSGSVGSSASLDSVSGLYYKLSSSISTPSSNPLSLRVPEFDSLSAGLSAYSVFFDDPTALDDSVGVKAYSPSGIADIPDTTDPNYDALNRAKDIPLNIPWDDAVYGDGTGTLTDAQSHAIAEDLTSALEQDRTVELVEESNPPAPSPDYSDVLLPLIPINVPSFNFSLSGIWHYVRDWVNSLGAWLSTLFSVWSILPYAIVVPVYACLVILIVLGLYKRFFM